MCMSGRSRIQPACNARTGTAGGPSVWDCARRDVSFNSVPRSPLHRRLLWRLGITLAAFCAGWLATFGVRAAVTASTPAGWASERAALEEAQNRAAAWATVTGYRLTAVMSTTADDDFAETLAVFEIAEPLPIDAVVEPGAAQAVLVRAVAPVVDSREAPIEFAIDASSSPGASVFRGTWEVGELTFYCALAPSGPTQSLVVMATRTQEVALHTAAFDSAVASLEGIAAPVTPLPRGTWRFGALLGWLLVGGVVYGGVVATADRSGDHVRNGQRSALVLAVLSMAAGITAYTLLGDQTTSLRLANVSREWMTVEIAAPGAIAAVLLWVLPRMLSGGKVVRSAPSGGAFAGRTGPAVPRLYNPDGPTEPRVAPESQTDSAASARLDPIPIPSAADVAPRGADLSDYMEDTSLTQPTHSTDQSTGSGSSYDEVDEDMKTRVASIGVPGSVISDKTPVPADSVHGEYGISHRGPPPAPPPSASPGASAPSHSPERDIEEKTPVPADSSHHGQYSISKKE